MAKPSTGRPTAARRRQSLTVKPITRRQARDIRRSRRRNAGGKPAHREILEQHRKAERQEQILGLLAKGMTYRQIGQAVGVSHVTVMNDLDDITALRLTHAVQMSAKIRVVEDETLNETKRAMMPLVHGQVPARTETRVVGRGKRARTVVIPHAHDPLDVGRLQAMAAQRVVNISARRAALWGADAPLKVAPTDPGGEQRYHGMTEDELERMNRTKRTLLGEGAADDAPVAAPAAAAGPARVLVPVVSSNIRAVGYADGDLVVLFQDGAAYCYRPVPAEVHAALMAAPSKGSYLHRAIKANAAYACERLDPAALAPWLAAGRNGDGD